ncbi:hypothetical protein D3C80_1710780 [compost metagenome]
MAIAGFFIRKLNCILSTGCRDNLQMKSARGDVSRSRTQNHPMFCFRHLKRTKGIKPLGQRFSEIGRHMLHNNNRSRKICRNIFQKRFERPGTACRAAYGNQLTKTLSSHFAVTSRCRRLIMRNGR